MMTIGMQLATADARSDVPTDPTDELLVAKTRVGLWAVFLAIVVLTLADTKLPGTARHGSLVVRIVQFALIGIASVAMRIPMRRRSRLVTTVSFVSGLYVTSAIAGAVRHAVATQPITDLAIAFATATTLPWGAAAQLASVGVAAIAIVADYAWADGSLGATSPHMVVGIGLAFVVSVYIAHQLARFRRERDAAEVAVRQSEERFRTLIERGSDVITIIDAQGLIRYESPSVERLVGGRPDERIGQPAVAVVHPDDLPALRDAIARSGSAATPPIRCRTRRRDGSWCDVEAVLTNLLDHAAIAGVVVNWRDVSERTRAEEERARHMEELARARDQALASTHAKSMFLANVSHEIRTPMNVIIGMTDIVLDGTLAEDQRADLTRVRAAAIGLLDIINDILDASKIEAGKMAIEVVDLDLRRAIEEVVTLLTPAATGKGLALTATIAAGIPTAMKGDPVRIRQTLVNLVSNAIKFTERGSVDVDASVLRRTPTHLTVRLRVRDTGIGIARDRQAAIFDSFTQGDDSTTRLHGGTGLGLAISRQLVTLMGGAMGLESTPGRGSTFWFDLTLESAGAAAAAA